MKIYLAGPMSGYPQFNFPLFYHAAEVLRSSGWDVVSPAELDAEHGIDKEAMSSKDGNAAKLTQTWGDLLARDVKLISDGGIEGIIFLPRWHKSRGARLESFVGLLKSPNFAFFEFDPDSELVQSIGRHTVMDKLSGETP